ncbi:MAG: ABC transporter substrate-binding protein [Actinobacteria bacterium]|nr:ABC transporter substrate-binding protein [Actinomycetota bacterium]
MRLKRVQEGGCGRPRRLPGGTLATIVLAIMVLALITPGCGKKESTNVVKVGYLRSDLHQLAYYVAREKGFFTEEGLDVKEGGVFNAGPEEMSAFSAGELDMGYVGSAPAVTFAAQDMVDIQIVAQVNAAGSSIVVRSGLEAGDVSALKGRTVAVPGHSTVQDFLLRLALKEAVLEENEINIITLKPPETIAALGSGQVDAFVAWEPYPQIAVVQNAGWVLENSSEIWPHHPCCVLVVDRDFASRNPDTVRRFVAAHVKATQYINDNPLEAADMGHLFTGQDSDAVEAAMGNIEFVYKLNVEGLERYVEFLKEIGVVKVESAGSFSGSIIDSQFLPREN